MTRTIAIYGASGFGREVMPLLSAGKLEGREFLFGDDGAQGVVNGCRVLNFDAFSQLEGEKSVAVAIANSLVREKLFDICEANNITQFDVRASNVVSGYDVEIGSGSILCSFVTLTSNIRIGRGFHANIYSYVAHDCIIGDFVTFAPDVKCYGNVHIDDHAYIGTGAILKQGTPDKPLRVGKGAVIGMGAVVTKDVAPGAVVIGNPARPMDSKA